MHTLATLYTHGKKVERGNVSPPARERVQAKMRIFESPSSLPASSDLELLLTLLATCLGLSTLLSHLPCFLPFTLLFPYCPVNESCQLHIHFDIHFGIYTYCSNLTAQEILIHSLGFCTHLYFTFLRNSNAT